MIEILLLLTTLAEDPIAVEALRKTMPDLAAAYMTPEQTQDHISAARFAAAFVGQVDPDDLLAIAHHETRYTPTEVTNEGPGLWWPAYDPVARWSKTRLSCGVMTPQPKPTCELHELEIIGGYIHGAEHLKEHRHNCYGNRLCSLGGYSGWADDHQTPGYKAWQVFLWRSNWIKAERRKLDRARPTS